MPTADPEKRREYNRRYYRKHRDRQLGMRQASRKATHDRLKAIMEDAKSVPCMDCGQRYPPYVMYFDHRDPDAKVANVSTILKRRGERMLRDEIAKCDVVCANCHRERTHGGEA